MTKKAKTISQYIFFLGLGAFFIAWTLHELTAADKHQIKAALTQGRFGYLWLGFFILLLSHWVRAVRWRLLIEPLGYKPSLLNTFFAVMVGYLANQAIPRLGELLRCSTLTRYEKIPTDKLLGTVILERIVDTICLLLLFIFTLAAQPNIGKRIIHTFFSNHHSGNIYHLLLWIAIVSILLIAIALLCIFITKKKAPHRFQFFKKVIRHVWQGIISIKSLKYPGQFIFLSILLWGLYAACVYVSFFTLKETINYGWMEALTVLCAGSLGMVATPGGIGAYAFMVQKTMLLYQLNSGVGLALGWLLWFLQTGTVLLIGGLSFLAFPIINSKKNNTVNQH